jgi:hypothetical protein
MKGKGRRVYWRGRKEERGNSGKWKGRKKEEKNRLALG